MIRGSAKSHPTPAPWVQLSDFAVAMSIVVAIGLWRASLPLMNPNGLTDYGLVAILPWQYWAALGLLSIGFSFSFYPSMQWPALRWVSLIALVLILHATPPIVYGTLRYSWAWKHIGIVDYLQRYGEVNRTIPVLAAYHNWPGFFWISAKLASFFSLEPLQIANLVRFFPVASNLVFLILLRSIYRRFTDDDRLVLASLWVFFCANWVGQDYFSPQAFAYSLHLLVLALCLGPLMPSDQPARTRRDRWIWRVRAKLTPLGRPLKAYAHWQKMLAIIVVSLSIFGIVASHQLTPLILVFSLFGLSVITPLSFRYPTLMAFALVYWIIYPAAPFTAAHLASEVAQLGQTMGGVTDKLVDTSTVDRGVAVVVWAGRILSIVVVFFAMFGWLRRLIAGQRDGIVCVLVVAPTLILGVTTYGGEAVFRIYFFCLPFFAFFCAGLFFPSKSHGTGVTTRFGFCVLVCFMSIGFLFGNNGKDRQYRFSTEEIEAAAWLYSRSGPETLLVEGARSYPSQFMNYEHFTYVPIANETSTERTEILQNPAKVLDRWFSSPNWDDGYVILTRSQQAYVEALAIMPKGALEKFAFDLLASSDFELVFANQDVRIFTSRRFLGQ